MKKIMSIIFILSSFFSISQIGIVSNFNVVASGRNQTLLLNYSFKEKLTFSGGIKYNFNKPNDFPNSRIFKKNFYALNSKDRLGFEIGSTFQIWKNEYIKFNMFYMFQYTKSNLRHDNFYAIGGLISNPQSVEDFGYVRIITDIDNVIAYENNIGVNFNIKITENIYLNQKFGVGIIFHPENANMTVGPKPFTWELSETISFGLGYTFNKKAHNKT